MHDKQSTPKGFEPLRAEPNGFPVYHLSHSVTVSLQHPDFQDLFENWQRQHHPSSPMSICVMMLCYDCPGMSAAPGVLVM